MALTMNTVVDGALAHLDKTGLDAWTLSGVAGELNVKPPALYWHVKNRDELLAHVADKIAADIPDLPPSESWQTALRTTALGMYDALLAHRDGARIFAEFHLADGHAEQRGIRLLEILQNDGFSEQQAVMAASSVVNLVVGSALETQAHPAGKADREHQRKTLEYGIDAMLTGIADRHR